MWNLRAIMVFGVVLGLLVAAPMVSATGRAS